MLHEKSPADRSLNAVPAWVRDAVFYQIFPDRFAHSDRVPKPRNLEAWEAPPTLHGFKGGDLVGIAERLDYLVGLGVTALYLTPIFTSAANHRYHTFDYFNVDPLLGGNDALRFLLDSAHAKGVRVVLDGVFNHASRGFFQFNHVMENGRRSPYVDWFHFNEKWLDEERPLNAFPEIRERGKQGVQGIEAYGYECWWNLPALPKLNTDNPEVRRFIFDVAEHWLRFGIDGWRLDVPNEIDDDDFWREFRTRVKGINADAYIVGEIWEEPARWLQGDQFDAVMNYELGGALLRWSMLKPPPSEVVRSSNYAKLEPLTDADFQARLERVLGSYSVDITLSQMNIIGSHDTPRVASMMHEDAESLKLVAALQFCMPGTPCIYYGDEIAMPGAHDPDCRRSFPAPRELAEALTPLGRELHDFYQKLIALRHSEQPLRRGSSLLELCENDVLLLRRCHESRDLLVAANRSRQARTVTPRAAVVSSLFGPATISGGTLTLPPRSVSVLQL